MFYNFIKRQCKNGHFNNSFIWNQLYVLGSISLSTKRDKSLIKNENVGIIQRFVFIVMCFYFVILDCKNIKKNNTFVSNIVFFACNHNYASCLHGRYKTINKNEFNNAFVSNSTQRMIIYFKTFSNDPRNLVEYFLRLPEIFRLLE